LTIKIADAIMKTDFPWYDFIEWHDHTLRK